MANSLNDTNPSTHVKKMNAAGNEHVISNRTTIKLDS